MTKKLDFPLFLLLSALLLAPFPAFSNSEETQSTTPAPPEKISQEDVQNASKDIWPTPGPSETEQTVTINGTSITYRTTAELLPFLDDQGEEIAHIFYVGYVRTDLALENEALRPISFAFNGGPGSSALMLHLGLLGPKAVKTNPKGIGVPSPPYLVQENPNSLLDITDLVFIDPIGTGYSKALNQEDSEKFWGVKEDADSMAEFIRMYLTREDRWGAPIYLIGESYGGIRATAMAQVLADIGIVPSGIVLISPALSYGELQKDSSNHRPFIHHLTAMAAAAWYHKKLSPELESLGIKEFVQQVHSWAQGPYAQALWKGNSLSLQDFKEIASQLEKFTGVSQQEFIAANLRLPSWHFAYLLLRDERKAIGHYDTRLTTENSALENAYTDPSFAMAGAPYYTAFMAYLQQELGFVTDRKYFSFNDIPFEEWNFASGQQDQLGYPNTTNDLALLMRTYDFVKVFVAMGYYDMVCPKDSILYSLQRMDLPRKRLQRNMTFRTYEGGHMMYTNPEVREALKADLADFYQEQ